MSSATPRPGTGSSRASAAHGDAEGDGPSVRREGLSLWLGRQPYRPTWDLQKRLQRARIAEELPDLLLYTEHPPTYTIGRSGKIQNLLWSEVERERLGIELVEVDRGGDITYHGPGQLVGYPIVHLDSVGRDVHEYMRRLEQVLIGLMADFEIEAGRRKGLTGVWVGHEKVAAMGVRISRWVAMHGFALNVDPDLSHFSGIVPCGIQEGSVTSLARLLSRPINFEEVMPSLTRHFETNFGLELRDEPGGSDWLDSQLRKLEG
ncbi:MAG: lipoyl(octanoyl) transferase LipB [Planctomycetota bacterium]